MLRIFLLLSLLVCCATLARADDLEAAAKALVSKWHEEQISKGLATDAAPGTPKWSAWWCNSFKERGTCLGDDRAGCKWNEEKGLCKPAN